jgi:hypothetical protein
MKIPLLDGRDFRRSDTAPGAAIVNQAFAKEYFHGGDPVGRSFNRGNQHFEIVGLVRDARYRNMREPLTPTGYLPPSLSGTWNAFERNLSGAKFECLGARAAASSGGSARALRVPR